MRFFLSPRALHEYRSAELTAEAIRSNGLSTRMVSEYDTTGARETPLHRTPAFAGGYGEASYERARPRRR